MIVIDFQPFLIINDTGFVEFVTELVHRYNLSCANNLSNALLSKYYKLAKAKLDDILKDCTSSNVMEKAVAAVITDGKNLRPAIKLHGIPD